MKMTKRFVALLMALAMCVGVMPMSAFAADSPEFAENEKILEYEEEAGIVPYSNDYASAWIPAGQKEGYFTIDKSFIGEGHITYKARSDADVTVNMCVSQYDWGSDLMSITGFMTIKTDDQEYKPDKTVASKRTYYVHYKFPNGNPDGTFLMCWIYG